MMIDVMLPWQFRPRREREPEQQLMIAVLQDALDCLEKYRGASDLQGQRLFGEAAQWLLAGGSDWLYSFEHICAVLDLDSDAVRQRMGVAPYRHAALRAIAPDGHAQAEVRAPRNAGTTGGCGRTAELSEGDGR